MRSLQLDQLNIGKSSLYGMNVFGFSNILEPTSFKKAGEACLCRHY